jgi:hypothetical protein
MNGLLFEPTAIIDLLTIPASLPYRSSISGKSPNDLRIREAAPPASITILPAMKYQ